MKGMDQEDSFLKLTGHVSWPIVLENGRISTGGFLEASKVILKIFDHLGALYIPVKHDVEGNINKLHSKYLEDPSRFQYIQDMIEHEVAVGESCVVDSLLWLKRGLHFICLFLHALVLDHERNVRQESLLENMKVSYTLSLKPYHNWVLQKLFLILSRAAPTREELLRSLTTCTQTQVPPEMDKDEIFARIKGFVQGLQSNLEVIFSLYVKLNLDDKEFVAFPTQRS